MKRLLAISGVLSWFNLVVLGFIVIMGTLTALLYMGMQFLVPIFFLSGILLHSYAVLNLRKSIKNPGVPLGNQTQTGVRLLGGLTLFFGIMFISQGIAVLQNTQEVTKTMDEMMNSLNAGNGKKIDPKTLSWGSAIFIIVTGLCCAGNAILSFRMLRGYVFTRSNDQGPKKEG